MPEDFSSFERYMRAPNTPLQPSSLPSGPVPATGTGNWFTSGVMAGFHGGLSEGARALQAGAQLAGADDTAKSLSDFAEARHAAAQSYARSDLEANPWSLPGIGYQIAKMIPVSALAVGGGALAAASAPEAAVGAGVAALTGAARTAAMRAAAEAAAEHAAWRGLGGASLAMYPFAVGSNVERQISETGALTTPGTALALGVPEAVVQGVVPGLGTKLFGHGIMRGIAHGAAMQGVAGGATEALTQLMGDPDRGFADRAAAIGGAALSNAALGGILGGGFAKYRELVSKPVDEVTNKDLETSIEQMLSPRRQQAEARAAESARGAESPIPPIKAGPPLQEMPPLELWQRFNKAQEVLKVNPQDADALEVSRLLGQEFTRRSAEMEPAPAVPEPPRQLTYQPAMGAPLTDIPSGQLAGQIDVYRPPRNQHEAEEIRRITEELQRREAEKAAGAAATVEALGQQPKLLPPPSPRSGSPLGVVQEGPPLQEMNATNLMDRFHFVQQWFATNPVDPRARRAFETTGQEVSRRMEEAGKTWTAPVVAAPNLPPLWDQARNIVEPAPPGPPVPPGAPAPPAGEPVRMPAVPEGGAPGRGTEVWRPPAEPAPVAPVEPTAPVAPVEPAASAAPVIDFTKRMSQFNYSPKLVEQILNGPPEVLAKLQNDLIASIAARGKKPLTKLQENWARDLELLDENGKLIAPVTEETPSVPPQWETPERAAQREQQAAQSTAALDTLKQTLDETRTKATAPGEVIPTPARERMALEQAKREQLLSDPEALRAYAQQMGIPEAEMRELLTANQRDAAAALASAREAVPPISWKELPPEAAPIVAEVAPAPPPVSAAPIKTAEDQLAALNSIADRLGDPSFPKEMKDRFVEDAKKIIKMLPNVETNPGAALSINVMLTKLRNQVEAEVRRAVPPADAVATQDLKPSPTSEAVPASTGDADASAKIAQDALAALSVKARGGLGTHPGAGPVLDAHQKWLGEVRNSTGTPEEARALLARDPEIDPEGDNLSNLTRTSPLMRENIDKYRATHEAVLQDLRAQSDARSRVVATRDGLPTTRLDADITDQHRRGVLMTDAADHVIENTASPEEALLVAKLKPFVPEGTRLGFRDGVTDKEGEYFTKQKLSMLYNAADATRTFIHEMAHAVFHRVLELGGVAARAIHGIYDQLKVHGDHFGITDAHEMLSEAFANSTYREFLKSKTVQGTSLWDRLVDTMRGFIGLDPRLYNAFDRIMEHGDDLLREQRTYPNEWLGPDSYALVANRGAGAAAAGAKAAEKSMLEKITSGIGDRFFNTKFAIRGIANGWSNAYWNVQDPVYRALAPSAPKYVDTLRLEDPRKKQVSQGGVVADQKAWALSAEGREVVNELQALSTSYGVHPDWGPAEYIDDIKNNPNKLGQIKATTNAWNRAGQIPGAQEAYNTWRSHMSSLGHMSALLNLQEIGSRITGLPVSDSFGKYDVRSDLTNNPKLADRFWKEELDNEIKAYTKFNDDLSVQRATIEDMLATKRAAAKATGAKLPKEEMADLTSKSKDLESQIDELSEGIKLATAQQKRMFKEPYFHLGRNGEFFLTGKLVTAMGPVDPETGKAKPVVDQNILSKLYDRLQKHGINDVAIMEGNQHDTFYTRVETPAQLRALEDVLRSAQKDGLLSDKPLAGGSILDSHIFNRVSSSAMQRLLERMRADRPTVPVNSPEGFAEALAKSHGERIQDLQRALLGMMPETSMSRLTAHRQNVQGFSKNMLASQAYAADVAAFSIARQSLQRELSAHEGGMLKEVEEANRKEPDLNTRLGLSQMVGELMLTQRLRQTYVPKDWKEAAKAFTNSMHTGMNPGYFPMQMSSVLVTGLPELIKTHGLGESFGAINSSVGSTFRVLNALRQSPDWLTAGITLEWLQKQKLPQTLINEIIGMEQRGTLGTYTESIAGRSPSWFENTTSPLVHKVSDTVRKAMNTIGMYSDLAPKIMMGLAAGKLYDKAPVAGKTREQFVDHVVDQSQGVYGAALGARQMGKGGPLGSYQPMSTQFMSWNVHLMNKIYQEGYNAFAGDSPEVKTAARKWLAGHAAAVTMLSGTLGLPMVSTAASVYDWVANKLGNRDDNDLIASYRTWLESWLGKDMGEIAARGLPRAAGMDFTNWGEGEIIPGSSSLKIFTEKRKWEDVERDWFKSIAGPAPDQMFQLGLAARDLLNGDILEGLGRFMPGLISGPIKAYRLSHEGFVDQHGQKLPILSPGAGQYIMTALGIKPARLAEYQEVAREESGLRTLREASSANISQHLRQAYTQRDPEMFNSWMAEAQRWQAAHPGLMPPQATFQRALQNHMNQLAQAHATGLPINVLPRDIAGRGLLHYGNIPMQ
jgi:hypothetical protein